MRAVPIETAIFISFDGGVTHPAEYQRPDRYRMIEADLSDRPRIARGGGYSYAAASFGAGILVQEMTRFNRILRFDPASRLVEVEAGANLGDLLDVTGQTGLWLPIQPGYPAITIGGCIASNAHGKNAAREGTFVRSVQDLTLYHPKHGFLRVDPETMPRLFDLTCGGYGLTGVILAATLRLDPLPGGTVSVRRIPVSSLDEGLSMLRTSASRSTFAYTWHSAGPARRTFGRGFLFDGSVIPGPVLARYLKPPYRVITAARRARLPLSLLTPLTTRAFSSAYRYLEGFLPSQEETPVFDFLFPFARRAAYFRLYGRAGLAEYQVLVPHKAIDGFLSELQRRILQARAPTVMLALKVFEGDRRLLRFDGSGICVTLNLIRSVAGLRFLTALDELTIASGAIPNLIKDSRLPKRVVQACFPDYELFREELLAHDPARLYRSELSGRIGL